MIVLILSRKYCAAWSKFTLGLHCPFQLMQKTSLSNHQLLMEKAKASDTVVTSKYFGTDQSNQRGKLRKRRKLTESSTEKNDINSKEDGLKNIKLSPVATDSNDTPLVLNQSAFKDKFFDVPCLELAKKLLGKILVRVTGDKVLKGRIVETECYLGGEDKASQSYGGKKTDRNAPMFMKPGTIYVYLTYGMYHCFNISSQGEGAAVLIRALEPVQGVEHMTELRCKGVTTSSLKQKGKEKAFKPHELCNGPAKLCIAMNIRRDNCNKRDLCSWPGLFVEADAGAGLPGDKPISDAEIVISKRIGIDSVEAEWANKPLRFYILGNSSVSKRDKQKEKELTYRNDPGQS